MKPANKKIIWVIVGVIAVVVVFIIYFARKAKSSESNPGDSSRYPKSVDQIDNSEFPLLYGSQNIYVEMLQKWLLAKDAELPIYGVDGWFATETQQAVVFVTGKNSVSYNDFVNLFENDNVFRNLFNIS